MDTSWIVFLLSTLPHPIQRVVAEALCDDATHPLLIVDCPGKALHLGERGVAFWEAGLKHVNLGAGSGDRVPP